MKIYEYNINKQYAMLSNLVTAILEGDTNATIILSNK